MLIQAGRTLALRFMEKGQYLCSFVGPDSLFIDIMMNVPLIFYAANETGDDELDELALAHCRTTRDRSGPARRLHRPRRACSIRRRASSSVRATHQGLRDDSRWARGLAWSLYGLARSTR